MKQPRRRDGTKFINSDDLLHGSSDMEMFVEELKAASDETSDALIRFSLDKIKSESPR